MTATQDTRRLIDPELIDLLAALPTAELSAATLEAFRNGPPLELPVAGDSKVREELLAVPSRQGDPAVPLLIYRPHESGAAPLGAILHIHGGGYVAGRAAEMAPLHRELCLAVNCAIFSVDYRLAPETRFPGNVEDCYSALAWLFAHAKNHGVAPERIGVMGESAGGGLAAALALLARDRGEFPLAFQHLIYPMLDDRTGTSTDPHPFTGEFIWTAANNRFGWSALLGASPGSEGASAYAAPARAADLAGLPSTFIATAALDLFVEENIEYARRLLRAGVPTELHVYPGSFHGFDLHPTASVACAARRDSRAALRRFLHST